MYSIDEISEIFKVAEKHNAVIVLDTIFSELEFNKKNIVYSFNDVIKKYSYNSNFILLGGLSKELAAGGLRIGYAYSESSTLQNALMRGLNCNIPLTIRYAARKIYSILNRNGDDVLKHFKEQSKFLKQRAETLCNVLVQNGWEPLVPKGGLFIIAKPTKLIGKKVKITKENKEITLQIDANNIHEVLYLKTALLINGSQWTGIEEYCRFVLSVTDEEFSSAIEKLKLFWSSVN